MASWSSVDLEKLRTKVLADYEKSPEKFHVTDINAIKGNVSVMRTYTDPSLTYDENVSNAVDTLHWRKSNGYHDVKAQEIPVEYYRGGIISYFDCGDTVLVHYDLKAFHKASGWTPVFNNFLLHMHKVLEDKFLTTGKRYNLLANMNGASMSNVDMTNVYYLQSLMLKHFFGMYETIWYAHCPFLLRPIVALVLKVTPSKYAKKVVSLTEKNLFESLKPEVTPKDLGGSNGAFVDFSVHCPQDILTTDDIGQKLDIKKSNIAELKKEYSS
ncbi:hypothetical protein HDE_08320 [Halotydeus destructor]|nr:hypothetical protein HDE_08320 [Halotydeus destructor]